MRINEIDLSKSDEKEIGEMTLRKAARLLKSNPHVFPGWFKLFAKQFSGPAIEWPVKGKNLSVRPGLAPLTMDSNIWMNINGYSTNQIFVQDFVGLYILDEPINDDNKKIYFPALATFMANAIRVSDPAFRSITPADFDVRSANTHTQKQYVLSRSPTLKAIIEPEMKKHSYLISVLYKSDKLLDFANLIKQANP